MIHYLILFDDIPIDKTSVKSGDNSPEVIIATRCVNVGLFLSGDMRRNVVISLAKGPLNDLKIISFPGENLKRVSPDERSISFFLMKASSIAEQIEIDSHQIMDNGIEVRRCPLNSFIESFSPSCIFKSRPENQSHSLSTMDYTNSLVIHSQTESLDSYIVDSKRQQKELPYYLNPERLILDINMMTDNNTP
jgi:hypothetical protein